MLYVFAAMGRMPNGEIGPPLGVWNLSSSTPAHRDLSVSAMVGPHLIHDRNVNTVGGAADNHLMRRARPWALQGKGIISESALLVRPKGCGIPENDKFNLI